MGNVAIFRAVYGCTEQLGMTSVPCLGPGTGQIVLIHLIPRVFSSWAMALGHALLTQGNGAVLKLVGTGPVVSLGGVGGSFGLAVGLIGTKVTSMAL